MPIGAEKPLSALQLNLYEVIYDVLHKRFIYG